MLFFSFAHEFYVIVYVVFTPDMPPDNTTNTATSHMDPKKLFKLSVLLADSEILE